MERVAVDVCSHVGTVWAVVSYTSVSGDSGSQSFVSRVMKFSFRWELGYGNGQEQKIQIWWAARWPLFNGPCPLAYPLASSQSYAFFRAYS